MAIKKCVPNWLLISALLAPIGVLNRSVAQPATETKPLSFERIARERDYASNFSRDSGWSKDGEMLSFIRTFPAPRRATRGPANFIIPSSEIHAIDTSTGQEKILVTAAQVAAAFGGQNQHAALGEESEETARARQLQRQIWAPDRHALLLATGNSLAWFDLDSHAARRLVPEGKQIDQPQISPDGRFVSFVRDHTLWLADASSGAVHAVSSHGDSDLREGEPDWVYRRELGMHAAYWWSPDSSTLAWLEIDDRAVDKYSLQSTGGDENSIAYPKPGGAIPTVHLYAVPVSGGTPVAIDLGKEAGFYLPRIQWLPDAKHLALQRLSRDQKTLELLFADVVTGQTRTILTEKDAYWINLADDLRVLQDSRRFLWTSERSGYRHLYLYDDSGRQLAQLTRGNWEVTGLAAVDEQAGFACFTATEASPAERQLYRVNLDGTGFTRITAQKGTHEVLFAPSGTAFLDTWSDHATPPVMSIWNREGRKIAGIATDPSRNLPANQLSPMEFLTVKSHMGLDMSAWIVKPPNFDPGKRYPVILYAPRGPGEQIVRDAWGGDLALWFSLMAKKGYVVFAVDTRGSSGYGHLFEEPVHLRFGASEMADLRDSVMYLRSLPWIDQGRVGICGFEFGGFLALHGMLDRPLIYKSGFAGSPVSDWRLYDAVFAERYLEGPESNQDGWLASSPIENARNLSAPLLIAHATLDDRVHIENSLRLLAELLDQGKYADILLFPDRSGVFADENVRSVLFERLTDFFVKNL